MREDIRIYVDDVVEKIDTLSGYQLTNYLMDFFENVGNNETYEIDEDNKLDIDGYSNKLEFLKGVYNSIKRDEDKATFLRELFDNERNLDSRIVEEFKSMVEVPEELDIEEIPEEEITQENKVENEEPEYEDSVTIEEPEEKVEKNPEQKEEIQEGPAITEYKNKTEELEKELATILEQLNVIPEKTTKETDEMEDIINKTSYPEMNDINEKLDNEKKELEDISKEIEEKEQEKERYIKLQKEYEEYYENNSIPKTVGDYREKMDIYNQRITECDSFIKTKKETKKYKEEIIKRLEEEYSEVKGPLFVVEKWKFAELYNKEIEVLENQLAVLNEIQTNLYKENKGIPLEIYGMKTKLENQIKEMKDVFREKTGIRSDFNLNDPEYKPIIDAIKNGRNLREEVDEELKNKFNINNEKDIDIDNEELKSYAEKLKEEINKRKENIAKYEDTLKDIKEIENDIKSGKTIEEDRINNIKNKINEITDDKLKEELNNALNKALEQIKTIPPKIIGKDPNKWKKWISGIAGVALGAGLIALTPLTGIGGGITVALGSQVIKKVVNKVHEKLKKENEITDIEKTEDLSKFKEKIKGWFRDENVVKNINWFLNGTSIGAVTMGLVEATTFTNHGDWTKPANNPGNKTVATNNSVSGQPNTPAPQAPADPYSNIKVGSSANGMDLSTGYDQANWATGNLNPETLNQGIMKDGNSIIDGFGVMKNGSVEVVDAAGKSLSEVAQQYGVPVEDIALKVTNQAGAPRAWVNVQEAVGRALR